MIGMSNGMNVEEKTFHSKQNQTELNDKKE